jgi:hypothetical protein
MGALALALVAGCGSDDEKTQTAVGALPTTTVSQTATNKQTKVVRNGTAVTKVTGLTGFSSPTKNIGCYIDASNVRCDIRKRSWKPPRAPRKCELDYGQGINLSAGKKPSFVCAGDTALGPPKKLPYGQAIVAGALRCDSKHSGMTCRDTNTRHGFTLSRESYRLF